MMSTHPKEPENDLTQLMRGAQVLAQPMNPKPCVAPSPSPFLKGGAQVLAQPASLQPVNLVSFPLTPTPF